MNTARKVAASAALVLLGAGVASFVWTQRVEITRLREEKLALQQQLEELNARTEKLAAEKEAFSNSAAAQDGITVATNTPDTSGELLRLRGEVSRLRWAEQELDQGRLTAMQAAQARLADARAELVRARKMREVGAISESDLIKADFEAQALEAAAKGDTAEEARIRLRQAEAELARAGLMRNAGAMSQGEYEAAAKKVEEMRAKVH
jgi:hypothetical protein